MTLLVPEFLQTKSYSAIKDRYAFQHLKNGLAESMVAEVDYKVSQRAAGADMSVDVGTGTCWVQGDDTSRQGTYHLVNDATVNVAVSAAHATLPRIDIVVARIYDSSVVGASDTPAIEVIAGTPTSGATLANRLGAPALPNGAFWLADLLVPAASTSVVNANIGDKRQRASGMSNIPTQESRTDTAYGLMTTPDQVANVVLPTDGILLIAYQAVWSEAVAAAGRAAIFIDANQLKISEINSATPVPQDTGLGGAGLVQPLTTFVGGLASTDSVAGAVNVATPEVATGQVIGSRTATSNAPDKNRGGYCEVFAAAGTYTVSVQFKSSSGSVTAKNRHLWVTTRNFDRVSF